MPEQYRVTTEDGVYLVTTEDRPGVVHPPPEPGFLREQAGMFLGGLRSEAEGIADVGKGVAHFVLNSLNPLEGENSIVNQGGQMVSDAKNAYASAKEGKYAKAFGDLLGINPLIETAKDDPLRALGQVAAGVVLPKVAKSGAGAVPKVATKGVEVTGTLAEKASVRNLSRTLDATTKQLKAVALDKVIPGIQERRIVANSLESLAETAEAGIAKYGVSVNEAIANEVKTGVRIKTQPLIDRLEAVKNKNALVNKETGEIMAERASAVAEVTKAQEVLRSYGDTIRPDNLIEVRRFLDEPVAKGKMAFLVDPTKGFELVAMEDAANVIRRTINEEFPSVAAANNEFSFYQNLKTVADATLLRKSSQSGIVGQGVKLLRGGGVGALAGGAVGGPGGAAIGGVVGRVAEAVHDSPAYRTRMSVAEHWLANKLSPTAQRDGRRPWPSIKVYPGRGDGNFRITPPPAP